MPLESIYGNISEFDNEIALKIEQSFPINNNGIRKTVHVDQIVFFGIKNPKQWGITNYAEIDLYQKAFKLLLNDLKNKGVKKIHLFATTPVSLSFSLGRVINHYHPEIIVYNYNNGRFDWGINLSRMEVVMN
jgi:hypothetical protein